MKRLAFEAGNSDTIQHGIYGEEKPVEEIEVTVVDGYLIIRIRTKKFTKANVTRIALTKETFSKIVECKS